MERRITSKRETTTTAWYAVLESMEDEWGFGSEDLEEAKQMLKRQGRGLIALISGGVCVAEIRLEGIPTAEEAFLESMSESLEHVNKIAGRSAWNIGVAAYSEELMETVREYGIIPSSTGELERMLLNGASTWEAYSYGGCALIFDSDIARRLCTRSELERTREGERSPNRSEAWLDVQARALKQASKRVRSAYMEAREN